MEADKNLVPVMVKAKAGDRDKYIPGFLYLPQQLLFLGGVMAKEEARQHGWEIKNMRTGRNVEDLRRGEHHENNT